MMSLMRKPTSLYALVLLLATALFAAPAVAQQSGLDIQIVGGVKTATPIAVVPFAQPGVAPLPTDVADVIRNDLNRSGKLRSLAKKPLLFSTA